MQENLSTLDASTIKKLMKMEGNDDLKDITEEEIEKYRKGIDYDKLQSELNKIENLKKGTNKEKEVVVETKSNNANKGNKTGMPNMSDMMKMMQEMGKGENGKMDFNKLFKNPDLLKTLGNFGGDKSGNMIESNMMKSFSNVLWFISWIQQIFSFIFSFKGLVCIGFLYWYFFYNKTAVLNQTGMQNNGVNENYSANQYVDEDEFDM